MVNYFLCSCDVVNFFLSLIINAFTIVVGFFSRNFLMLYDNGVFFKYSNKDSPLFIDKKES